MDEWTEQEEQQIIERAKSGDPEANYALSLWALSRGEEEPDEPRWNRLAAKCLVKAAQAGYGPAKEQMASLLRQSGQAPAKQSAPKPAAPKRSEKPAPSRPAPKPVSVDEEEEEEDVGRQHGTPKRRSAPAARPSVAARFASPLRQMARRLIPQDDEMEGFDVDDASWDDGYDDETPPPARRGRRGRSRDEDQDDGADSGGRWGDDKWRRLEFICVFVCAVLLIVIAVMLFSHKRGGNEESSSGTTSAIPPAGDATSADTNDNSSGNNGGITAAIYPDEATRAAIMAADLDIQPSPEDYVTEPTNATVSVSSQYLRLRKGPNVTYDPIAQMPNGTTVSVFAKKNDWDLILYQGDDGPVYGWCSSEYVILTAGAAASAAPTNEPGDIVG